MTTISSIIDLNSPKPLEDKEFDAAIKKFSTYTGLKPMIAMIDNIDEKYKYLYDIPTFLGIEVEVEGVNYKAVLPKFWEGKQDGSLRGPQEERAEFTTIPLRPRQALIATAILWPIMKELGKPSFSWRTSVHDHINVMDLREEEFKSLMVLSALFEPLLFNYVGGSRAQSVFCVPITESCSHQLLGGYLRGKIGFRKLVLEKWYKYSSVNMARLLDRPSEPRLGTVEFRHMGGTANVNVVLRWHAIILCLFKAAIAINLPTLKALVLEMDSLAKYRALMDMVFPPSLSEHMGTITFQSIGETISKVKEFFVNPPKLEPVKPKSALAAYAAHLYKKKPERKKAPPKKSLEDVQLGHLASFFNGIVEQPIQQVTVSFTQDSTNWNAAAVPPTFTFISTSEE